MIAAAAALTILALELGQDYIERRKKMAYRKTVKPKIDKKIFTNTAKKTKKINVNPKPSRGGIRL